VAPEVKALYVALQAVDTPRDRMIAALATDSA
jgi:hypothetical protein